MDVSKSSITGRAKISSKFVKACLQKEQGPFRMSAEAFQSLQTFMDEFLHTSLAEVKTMTQTVGSSDSLPQEDEQKAAAKRYIDLPAITDSLKDTLPEAIYDSLNEIGSTGIRIHEDLMSQQKDASKINPSELPFFNAVSPRDIERMIASAFHESTGGKDDPTGPDKRVIVHFHAIIYIATIVEYITSWLLSMCIHLVVSRQRRSIRSEEVFIVLAKTPGIDKLFNEMPLREDMEKRIIAKKRGDKKRANDDMISPTEVPDVSASVSDVKDDVATADEQRLEAKEAAKIVDDASNHDPVHTPTRNETIKSTLQDAPKSTPEPSPVESEATADVANGVKEKATISPTSMGADDDSDDDELFGRPKKKQESLADFLKSTGPEDFLPNASADNIEAATKGPGKSKWTSLAALSGQFRKPPKNKNDITKSTPGLLHSLSSKKSNKRQESSKSNDNSFTESAMSSALPLVASPPKKMMVIQTVPPKKEQCFDEEDDELFPKAKRKETLAEFLSTTTPEMVFGAFPVDESASKQDSTNDHRSNNALKRIVTKPKNFFKSKKSSSSNALAQLHVASDSEALDGVHMIEDGDVSNEPMPSPTRVIIPVKTVSNSKESLPPMQKRTFGVEKAEQYYSFQYNEDQYHDVFNTESTSLENIRDRKATQGTFGNLKELCDTETESSTNVGVPIQAASNDRVTRRTSLTLLQNELETLRQDLDSTTRENFELRGVLNETLTEKENLVLSITTLRQHYENLSLKAYNKLRQVLREKETLQAELASLRRSHRTTSQPPPTPSSIVSSSSRTLEKRSVNKLPDHKLVAANHETPSTSSLLEALLTTDNAKAASPKL